MRPKKSQQQTKKDLAKIWRELGKEPPGRIITPTPQDRVTAISTADAR